MPQQISQKVDILNNQRDGFTSNLEHLVGRIPGIEKILQQVDLLPHARYVEELEQATVPQ